MSDVVVLSSSSDPIVVGTSGPVQVASTDTSAPGAAGPPGPAGDVAKEVSRAALAAVSASAGLTRALIEAGREGLFVFDSSNLSAQVTADPGQGIYVPPASDTTGASGAWVRKFSGAANVKWFGAVLDGTTDDTTPAQRALNLYPLIHIPAGTLIASTLSVPANTTILTDGLDTIIKQKSNPTTDTPVILVAGSNVAIGSLTIKGQLGLDESIIGTATVTIASPGVVTRTAHGLVANTAVMLRTTGALPTGLTAGLTYYVRNPAADTFELATLPNGASINTSGTQSGVHTLYHGSEQNHGIRIEANNTVGDLTNITIGDVVGENIRGDVLVTYSRDSRTLSQVRVGNLYGTNIYRCIAAPCTGSGIEIASVGGSQVGFMAFLIEPDGTCAPVIGCKVGHVKGRFSGVVGTDPTRHVDGVEIGTLDLDPAHGGAAGSTPAYPPFPVASALQVRNCKSLRIGKYKVNGHTGNALKGVFSGGDLAIQSIGIGRLEVSNCTPADSYVMLGNADNFRLEVGHVLATVPASGALFRIFNGLRVHSADVTLGTDSAFLSACDYGSCDYVLASGAGNLLSGGTNMAVGGGSLSGMKGIFSFTTLGMIRNLIATGLTVGIVNGGATDHTYENCTLSGTYYRHWNGSAIQSVTSAATVTPTFTNDQVNITAQAAALALANPTGTAIDAWGIAIRIKDNGTARAISYGTQYRAVGVTLPTTTVISKTLYLGMVYNAADTKWDVVAIAQEA